MNARRLGFGAVGYLLAAAAGLFVVSIDLWFGESRRIYVVPAVLAGAAAAALAARAATRNRLRWLVGGGIVATIAAFFVIGFFALSSWGDADCGGMLGDASSCTPPAWQSVLPIPLFAFFGVTAAIALVRRIRRPAA